MVERRIGPITTFFLYTFAIVVDIVQIILNLFLIGVLINRIISVGVGTLLLLFLFIVDALNSKTVMLSIGSFTGEVIPVLDSLPMWTLAVWRVTKAIKEEDILKAGGVEQEKVGRSKLKTTAKLAMAAVGGGASAARGASAAGNSTAARVGASSAARSASTRTGAGVGMRTGTASKVSAGYAEREAAWTTKASTERAAAEQMPYKRYRGKKPNQNSRWMDLAKHIDTQTQQKQRVIASQEEDGVEEDKSYMRN